MRLAAKSNSALARIAAGIALLALAACTAGEASPNTQQQRSERPRLIRGYNCTQSAIAGRYSCARSLDRQAQRAAAAQARRGCHSCGPVSSD